MSYKDDLKMESRELRDRVYQNERKVRDLKPGEFIATYRFPGIYRVRRVTPKKGDAVVDCLKWENGEIVASGETVRFRGQVKESRRIHSDRGGFREDYMADQTVYVLDETAERMFRDIWRHNLLTESAVA